MPKRETTGPQFPVTTSPLRAVNDKYPRILDAAVAVFAEKGFHAARISDIAERAGVADGTVYLYFKNKEEILVAAINTAFDAFVQDARAELKQIASPAGKLRRLAQMHLSVLGENRNLAVVLQMELRQSTRFLAQFSHQHMVEYFAMVRAAIREGQANGSFHPDLNEKIAANCFFGALDQMVTSWVLAEHEYSLGSTADSVVAVILLGLEK